MKHYSIALLCPNPADATSWYRGVGAWGYLYRSYPDIQITIPREISWPMLKCVDVVVFQRPATAEHLDLIRIIKMNNKKLILDYDDDFFCVPTSNPASSVYNREEVQKSLPIIIRMADTVIASTQNLKSVLSKYNNNVVVVPNAFDNDTFPPSPLDHMPSNNILWRGTESHREDLAEVSEGLVNIIKEFPRHGFSFWGFRPPFTYPPQQGKIVSPFVFPNVDCRGPIDIVQYMHNIRSLVPRIVIVPLKDSEFNRSKSSCSWLEATWGGGIVVAPDWEEWRHAGIMNYRGPEDFSSVFREALRLSDQEIKERNEVAFKEIRERYLLSECNYERHRLVVI